MTELIQFVLVSAVVIIFIAIVLETIREKM